MKIKLPLVHHTEKESGSKNQIEHLIELGVEFEPNDTESGRGYFKVKKEDDWIYLTTKKENIPSEYDKVLLSNKKITLERLQNGELKLRWYKHPKLIETSPENIIETWSGNIELVEENKERDVEGLRPPQIGAIYATLAHWKSSNEIATIVLPTGTGKTETMISLIVKNQCKKVLVIVPSDSLRDQLSKKFTSLGLLKQFGIANEEVAYPKVGVLKNKFNDINELEAFISKCNVVVSTINILTSCTDDEKAKMAEQFSNLFIDEAHHVKAKTWFEFREYFAPEKVLQFTATPYRNDGERLDGKIIFNFPLTKAREQGYFKPINFLPVKEYDPEKADQEIANKAVERLKEDIRKGYNHILMARCNNTKRADEIFSLYEAHAELNPVKIYNGITGKEEIMYQILSGEAKIIICVNMLGEGFDLPELKIAAFHDIRKSLPITLQFAGRFTRTSRDQNLGEASFVANIADINARYELEELYAQDADWNTLLPAISSNQIEEEVEFNDYISGFKKLDKSKIPFQNLTPALSCVVYKNNTNGWNPTNFKAGLGDEEQYDTIFSDINWEEKVLVVITGKKEDIEWGNSKDIYDVKWDIIIVQWDTIKNLLFIHGSNKKGVYKELAAAIIEESAELISGLDVYKAFHDIKRVKLQNVGLKEFLGKNIRFRMTSGSDIEPALTLAESQRAQKAFAYGVGYENGIKVSIGCSSKGRIWTRMTCNIKQFTDWSKKLSQKLSAPNIDPNTILKNTLIPKLILERPAVYPTCIDWDDDIYNYPETRFEFSIDGVVYNLSNCGLDLVEPSDSEDLKFALQTEDCTVDFVLHLFEEEVEVVIDGVVVNRSVPAFKIEKSSTKIVSVRFGSKTFTGEEFFNQYVPTFWFADGSTLTGNELFELKQDIQLYPKERIISWDWNDIDISKEAQGVSPKVVNSIQYKVIEDLKSMDFDVIYDDDYSGEIADILTIKQEENKLKVQLYHLKFATGGVVSNQIKNLYEVCGQAQKSVHWKHKSGKEFFDHLLRRIEKKKNDQVCSRLEKGSEQDLEKLQGLAKRQIPVEFEIFIVQPGFSKNDASESILTLLGVTENYLMDTAGIRLQVISSE